MSLSNSDWQDIEEYQAERAAIEADFKERHGYDWPNCGIADCENKACVPSDLCHPHSLQFYRIDYRPTKGKL